MAEIENVPLLIVDDDQAIRNLLARVAQRAGFAVETAKDGQEALEMIQQKHYAIAIVDLMMPRMNGYELLERIATMNPRPTVIVATAMANSDVAGLDESMVRRVLRKPFDINAVATALVEAAKQVAAQKEPADEPIVVDTSNVVQLPARADQQEKVAASGPADQQQEPPVEAPPAEEGPKVEEPPAGGGSR